tara:strand:- start:11432 stop:11890 length:459 start_codon:yes stop_codon:yes gene_type:complete
MFYETVKETAKQPSLWAMLAGVASTPVGLGVLGGLGGLAILAFISNNDEDETEDKQTVTNSSEGVKQPLQTVQTEEIEQLDEPYVNSLQAVDEPFEATVNEPLNAESSVTEIDVPSFSDEEIQAAMRRKVMSDMGKRSGEARRRKKQLAMQT